jgi:hypothetical protein
MKKKIPFWAAILTDILILAIATAIVAFLAPGCAPKTIPISTERFYSDTTIIRETQVPVFIPGKTVEVRNLSLDSMIQILKTNTGKTQTITRTDPKTGQTLKLIVDQLGNLSAICETQDQTIQILKREVDRLKTEIKNTVVEVQESWHQKLISQLGDLSLILILILILLFIIFRGRK